MTISRLSERVTFALLPGISFLVLWQALIDANPGREFLIGSPVGIWQEFKTVLHIEGTLISDSLITSAEAVLGFVAGTFVGTAFGMILWASKQLERLARPYLIALGALPVFALGPVLIFWLGTGIASKVMLAFLATFSVAVQQAKAGADAIDRQLLWVAESFGGTPWQVFCKIVLPASTLWVLSAARLNIGMALLGALIGEFLSSREGLGHMIVVAEGLYNVNRVWVGVGAVTAVALALHAATIPIERMANRWK